MAKSLFVTLIIMSLFLDDYAQNAINSTVVRSDFSQYNRSGLTWLYCNSGQKYSTEISNSLDYNDMVIPEKYDDNRLEDFQIRSEGNMNNVLIKNNVGTKIILNLITKDNQFSLEEVEERAKYTMSDAQFKEFKASHVGIDAQSSRKLADKILASNFIMAFDFFNIITMEEYYNQIDAANRERAKNDKEYKFKPVERTDIGFMGEAKVEVYKILVNDSLLEMFWTSSFPNNNEFNLRNALSFVFPVIYKASETFKISGNTSKVSAKENNLTNSDFFNMMTSSSNFNNFIDKLEADIPEFKVKAPIFSLKPIQVKIGLKEGVSPNKRYFIFEQIMKDNGEILLKRRGVIRAGTDVTDNRKVSEGEMLPTSFYQIQGRKLDIGMMTEENKDFATINLGYGNSGIYLKLDFLTNGMFTQAGRIYLDLDYNFISFKDELSEVTINGEDVKTNSSFYDIGIGYSKDFHFMRNIFIGPVVGGRVYGGSFNEKKLHDFIKEDDSFPYGEGKFSFKVGGRFGFYFTKDLKIIGSACFAPTKFADDDIFGKNSDFSMPLESMRFNISLGWDISY
jgi:hypothetical protein